MSRASWVMLLIAVIAFAVFYTWSKAKIDAVANATNTEWITPVAAKRIIGTHAIEVIATIQQQNMDELSKYVHPEKGVRLSPYSNVNIESDLIWRRGVFKTALSDGTEHTWGNFHGTDRPIALSFEDYFNKFVYDRDYASARLVGYNQVLGKGTMTNNVFEVYQGAIVVEYYWTKPNVKQRGAAWRSLRLIFENVGPDWYLVGIAHGQPTT